MSLWMSLFGVVAIGFLMTTPTPVPPILFDAEGLRFTLPGELSLLAQEDEGALFDLPAAGALIPLKTRVLFGAGYGEQVIEDEGWRWWGVAGTDPDNWGGYDEHAWVFGARPGFRGTLNTLEQWIRQGRPQLPLLPIMRKRACSALDEVSAAYTGLGVQPLTFANGAGFSALYMCFTVEEIYGDGYTCGGYENRYRAQMWYAFHGLTEAGTLVTAHVPLDAALPERSLVVTTCYDEETQKSTTTYEPANWRDEGWEEGPYGYPRLPDEARDALYAQALETAEAFSADAQSPVAQARALLDAALRTLSLDDEG